MIPHKPVPWSFVARGPGRGYRPKRVTVWQELVFMAARACLDSRLIGKDVPVRIDLAFCLKRPKSRSKSTPHTFIPHVVKPDRDNLVKAVQDALVRPPKNLNAIMVDDCNVCIGETVKVWNPVGVPSFVFLVIETGVYDIEEQLENMGMLETLHSIADDLRD